jgi:4-oxalocrotonate tautomerase
MPLVNVTMARGRAPEAKAAMLRAIADAIHGSIGAPHDSIRVWITEVDNTDFLAGTEILADKQARLAREAASTPDQPRQRQSEQQRREQQQQ